MKLNVHGIVRDHCLTLTDGQSTISAVFDFMTFYGLPFATAMYALQTRFTLRTDAYNVSITFFGIFIALLLNIQVAIFAIFQRKWIVSENRIEAVVQKSVLETRRRLLSELNSNISYLVLVCCAALFLVLCAYVGEWKSGCAPALTVFLYGHFLLTLLMVVKRSHALFQQEYKKE